MASALDLVGLDAVAETVYEALLACGPTGLPELVEFTGLPRWRVRGALDRLEATGLVGRSGVDARFMAGDPAIALDVLLLGQVDRLNRARARARELTERFQREITRQDPTELVEVVTGSDAIRQRTNQVQRSARRSLRILDKPPYAGDIDSANEAELALLRRGGEARLIYDRSALDAPGRLTLVEREVAAGERARTLPNLPTKLLIVDDRLAVVPLQAAPSRIESGVIVHPSALFEALSGLFDSLWALSLPLDLATGARPDPEPSPEDRRLLALLTAGLADEAISRQLGISYRTLQRRIHALMDRLNVQTRFQLGVQATRRSWISDQPAPEVRGQP